MSEKKSYYAIIPANVRYDKRLSDKTKLLYGEITALCNEKGYCWASNKYFADLYEVSIKTISRCIQQLIECGYILSEMVYKPDSKEIDRRYLRLNFPKNGETEMTIPMDKNVHTPTPKNVQDNNTVINNTINIKERKKERQITEQEISQCIQNPPTGFEIQEASVSKTEGVAPGYTNAYSTNNLNAYSTNTKERKKERKTTYDGIVSSFTDNERLKEAIYEFIKMRKLIKKPMTDRALTMLLNRLKGFAEDVETQIKILDQSIINNWQTVYHLKEEIGKGREQTKQYIDVNDIPDDEFNILDCFGKFEI